MNLHVSIYEAKIERSSKDFFSTELSEISGDTTLTSIFDICWKKQSQGTFNWSSYYVVAICRGDRHQDLSRTLSQLGLHQQAATEQQQQSQAGSSSSKSRSLISLQFVARNRHRPAGNSQQLMEQTLHALRTAALMPAGLLGLCKAARQLDVADVPGLGEDRRAMEIVTDYRLQGAMLRRPRLLQQLLRRHPVLATAIVVLVKRVQQAAQAARLPTAGPAEAIAMSGNMPLGANYNVDFESVLDEDDENGESEEPAAGAAAAAALPISRPSSSTGGGGAAGFSGGAVGGAGAGGPGGGRGVSSDFLRNAMAQAFTIIPTRQRYAQQLRALRDMGITDEEAALRVLEQHNGDLELAIDQLFS